VSLGRDKLEQTIIIRTTDEGDGIGVQRHVEPGFESLEDEEEFIAKTLISVLWAVYPNALAPAYVAHLDQMSMRSEDESGA
jgi:hypothetical protein